jgi:hypothetical protein
MKLFSCPVWYFLHNKKSDYDFMFLRYTTKMVIRDRLAATMKREETIMRLKSMEKFFKSWIATTTTSTCESINAKIAKCNMGKHLDLSGKGSFERRVKVTELAAAQAKTAAFARCYLQCQRQHQLNLSSGINKSTSAQTLTSGKQASTSVTSAQPSTTTPSAQQKIRNLLNAVHVQATTSAAQYLISMKPAPPQLDKRNYLLQLWR